MDWVQIDLVSRTNMDNIFNNNQSFMVAIQKIFFGKKYLLKKLPFQTISFSRKVWVTEKTYVNKLKFPNF